MAENPVKHSDLVKDDGAIQDLINDLLALDKTHDTISKNLIARASGLSTSLTKTSGAIKGQRDAIQNAAIETDKLAKAQNNLDVARSDTTKQINALKKSQIEYNKEAKLNAQITNAQVGSYNRLSAQYSLNKIQLNKMSKEVREGTKAGRAFEAQTKKIYAEMNRLQVATGKNQLQVGNYGLALNKVKTAALSVASALGFTGLIYGLVNAFKSAFKTIKEFDEEMVNLAALVGKARPEIVAIEDEIRQVAKTSINTAIEVAKVASALITLGKTEDEVIKLLKPVNDLSIALRAPADAAGELLVKTLNAFQESASEANKYADVIAKLRTSTSLDFQQIVDSLGFIAPVANAVGLSIERTGAIVGVLADNGIKAQRAGRLMATAFGRLAQDGLSLEDALAQINNSADKTTTAMDIFGAESFSLALILAKNIEQTDAYAESFENAGGSLDKLTKDQLVSISAQVKIASSLWTEFILGIDKGDGVLSKIVRGSLGAFVNILEDFTNSDLDIARGFLKAKNIRTLEQFNGAMEEFQDNMSESDRRVSKLARQFLIAEEAERIYNIAQKDGFKTVEDFRAVQDEFINAYADEKDNLDILNGVYDKYIAVIEDAAEKKRLEEEKIKKQNEAEAALQAQRLKRAEQEAKRLKKIRDKQEKEAQELLDKQIAAFDASIAARVKSREKFLAGSNEIIEQTYDLALSEIDILKATEEEKTRLRLDAEKKRLEAILNINAKFGGTLSAMQIQQMRNTITSIEGELINLDNKDLDIYSVLGFKVDDEQKEQMASLTSSIFNSLNSITQARLDSANKAVQASNTELQAAQASYDRQVELSRLGEANNKAGASRRLNDVKRTNNKVLAEQAKAQKAQERIQTAQQVGSLLSATAQIINAYSGLPFVGQALSIAAIAAMFGAFASAKIQTRKATKYGDGGAFDITDGGSHASGNDTSLGVHGGVERRVEKGEKAAVFNKKAVKRHGSKLTAIIDSVNKGTFTKKYGSAFEADAGIAAIISGESGGSQYKEILEENKLLREELKDIVRSIPQPIFNIKNGRLTKDLVIGNTTYKDVHSDLDL